ncbi:hypothetical protein Nmel_004656 [Mimus melanotis]
MTVMDLSVPMKKKSQLVVDLELSAAAAAAMP